MHLVHREDSSFSHARYTVVVLTALVSDGALLFFYEGVLYFPKAAVVADGVGINHRNEFGR